METHNLFIYGLAIWRIASLFVRETGPFNLFVKIRKLAGIIHDENGTPVGIPDGFFAGILSCVWCCSIWLSIGMTIFWLFFPEPSLKFSVVFAFSAVAILIDTAINKMGA